MTSNIFAFNITSTHRYRPTYDAVLAWLDGKNGFCLNDGATRDPSPVLSNQTLIHFCERIQQYDCDADSNARYLKSLPDILQNVDSVSKESENAQLHHDSEGNLVQKPLSNSETEQLEKACLSFQNGQYQNT